MRLLNTETLRLELFEGGCKLSYAILSHTWADDEVSYQDLVSGLAAERRAWPKVKSCCAKARAEGYQYVWIDTCCIDKSSSAELSEAINSMFKWYQDAEVCYAYLADVALELGLQSSRKKVPDVESGQLVGSVAAALEQSRWFTRGWTLQELLAPPDVVFFSATWRELGTRETLAFLISMATKIDISVLKQQKSLSSFSVAQRLSWASRRRTSKEEDEAYCLMGLFGVSMPLLYGEGQKAFRRLQLEIMKECYDPSILAWASADSHATIVGVLASSPAAFEGCGSIQFDTNGLHQDEYGSSGASHDVIGSSLRLETPGIALGENWPGIRLQAYDEGLCAHPDPDVHYRKPLPCMIHFPKDTPCIQRYDFFEFSFLHHERYSLILALLSGCKEGEHTVGITLCRDSKGLLKRVHYPTRFLLPETCTRTHVFFTLKTLHVSLAGVEALQKPLVPAWTRCLVRTSNLHSSPYTFSHTIPSTAPDAENCWYLNRWSTAVDKVTMTAQPCFSLHQAKVGRAIVFRHTTAPELSFRLVFSMWAKAKLAEEPGAARPLNLCVKAEIGVHVLTDGDEAELDGTPDKQMPFPVRRFSIEDRYQAVVRFRRSQQNYTLALVQVVEAGQAA